jgi:hypothetical protein
MPILIVDVLRAIRALREDPGALVLGVLTVIAIVGGGVFYWIFEDLGLLDALFLSVTTLTTIGYGDPTPATAAGKIFTCVFAIFGIGILLAFVASLASQISKDSVLRKKLADSAGDHIEGDEAARQYDLLVVGSDEESLRTALDAAAGGLRVVLVPRDSAISPMRLVPAGPTLTTDDDRP